MNTKWETIFTCLRRLASLRFEFPHGQYLQILQLLLFILQPVLRVVYVGLQSRNFSEPLSQIYLSLFFTLTINKGTQDKLHSLDLQFNLSNISNGTKKCGDQTESD